MLNGVMFRAATTPSVGKLILSFGGRHNRQTTSQHSFPVRAVFKTCLHWKDLSLFYTARSDYVIILALTLSLTI